MLMGFDIAQHFHGESFCEKPLKELDSSLIVFMPRGERNEIAMLKHLAVVNSNVEVPENTYCGKHFSKPDPHKSPPPYTNCEKRFFKKLEEKNLSQAPLLLGRQIDITSIGFLRYSYGSMDVRQVPVLKSSKFLQIDGKGGFDDDDISPFFTDIYLAKEHGQAILALLYSLSIPAKLKLMKTQHADNSTRPRNDIVFYHHDGILGMEELVMITLAWEVADELFTCSGEAHRMKQIHDDIEINVDSYLMIGRIVLRGLKLISKEFNKRRSAGLKHFKVMQAYRKITEMSESIQKLFSNAGIDNSKLEDMFSLDSLLDNNRVHRCHQHYAKEGKWNLVDV